MKGSLEFVLFSCLCFCRCLSLVAKTVAILSIADTVNIIASSTHSATVVNG